MMTFFLQNEKPQFSLNLFIFSAIKLLSVTHFILRSRNQTMKANEKELPGTSLLQEQGHDQQDHIAFLDMLSYANTREKIYMIVGAIAAALTGIAYPLGFIFFGQMLKVFTDREQAQTRGLDFMIKLVIAGSLYWIFSFISLYCWSYAASTQSMRMKKVYYQTLLQQEVAWYDSIDVGKLASKIAKNISVIQNAIGQKVSLLITAIFTGSFGIIFAFWHCWQLSLFLVAILPVIIYSGSLLIKSHSLRAKVNSASYQNASGIAEQAFASIRTIKYLVGEALELANFQQALALGNSKATQYITLVATYFSIYNFVTIAIYSIGMWLGKQILLWNTDNNRYQASDIIGTFYCIFSCGAALRQISPIFRNITEGKVAFGEMMGLFNRNKTLVEPTNGIKLNIIQKIHFQNVQFAYKDIKEQSSQVNSILKDINIQFVTNKFNAVVGQSGSGKSTIMQLLLRYYDCCEGSITINSHNIKDIDINDFKTKVGFVGQEPVLFAMTIQDNLKIANPNLTEDAIVQSLKKANAWEFIAKMEKGIKSFVGTGGIQLSGGQKQRIAIARAICKNPQLLILDEATSALDRKNQRQIQETLQNLDNSKITTIVIAHRLSTVKNAHKIFVMGKGRLIEEGNHEQLLHKNGAYRQLVQIQLDIQKKELLSHQSQNLVNQKLLTNNNYQNLQMQISDQKNLANKQKVVDQKQLKEDSVFAKLLESSKAHSSFILLGTISSIANGLITPFYCVAFGKILPLLNDVSSNTAEINKYCLYFFLIAVASAITSFVYTFSFEIVGDKIVYDLRLKLFQKFLKMPTEYYDRSQNTPGAISTKLSTETYQIHNMITGIIVVFSLTFTISVAGLFIAVFNCWKLALITLAFTPLLIMGIAMNTSTSKIMRSKSQRSEKFIGSLISDTVGNIRTVKSFGQTEFFMVKFQQNVQLLNEVAFQKSIKISFIQGMRRASIKIIEGLIIWIASILYSNGDITDGQDAIFISIFAIIFCSNTIGQTSQYMPDIAKARRSGALLFDILENQDEEQASLKAGGVNTKQIKGEIEFRNVSFKYPSRDNIVLQEFSLKVKAGERIALVGESGSGKSTVAQLLLRIYQPTVGSIYIDGINIDQYDLYHLRRQIGIVNQQPTMFLGTVDNNIRYNSHPSQEEFNAALSTACCKRFIQDWEQGLQKQVGQKGSQISGGQKQRIAIARCLIRKPTVLLLDESTSALDAQTESNVLSSLNRYTRGITNITIAHRLSTIRDADRIIVMNEGRILESGTYEELIGLKNNFYKLTKGS